MVAILRVSCALMVEPLEIIMNVVDGRMGRVRFGNGSKQPRERLDIDRDWRASIPLWHVSLPSQMVKRMKNSCRRMCMW